MISTLLALALAATQAQAQPQGQDAGWELLTAEGDSKAYYEPASVRGEGGDRVSVRMRIDLGAPGAEGMTRMLTRHMYDCGDRTIAYLSVHSYDARGTLTLSREVSVAEAEPEPFPADSVEATLYARVCRGR